MSIGQFNRPIATTDLRLRLDYLAGVLHATLLGLEDEVSLAIGSHEVDHSILIDLAVEVNENIAIERTRLIEIGNQLGNFAFPADVANVVLSEISRRPVRIRLLAAPSITTVPWELSRMEGLSPSSYGYIAVDPHVSFLRDVKADSKKGLESIDIGSILLVWADPQSGSYPQLPYVRPEIDSIKSALSASECREFKVDTLPHATCPAFLASLEELVPSIVHFSGHAALAPTGGALVFESGTPKQEALLHADGFATPLVRSGVKLVILSGCLTGGSSTAIGNILAVRGIPAVLAMAMPIQDSAARLFMRAFYAGLAEGNSIEDAVREGRLATIGMGRDWAAVQLMLNGEGIRFQTAGDEEQIAWKPNEKRTNLPEDDYPFIGRIKERTDLRRKIEEQRQRLITITGPGGMGKTRLSMKVGSEFVDSFEDGVWFVDCEVLTTEQELSAGVASQIPFSRGAQSVVDLAHTLASRRTLIILDCFENSVAEGSFVDSLLKSCPNLYVLVTSRVILGIPREFEYRLPSMSLSGSGGELGDGISLFVDAASHSQDNFKVTAKNKKLIRQLCAALEGIPLAIVLAAGRLRHMALEELLEQVQAQPLATLRRPAGGIERHSTIESVVAGSFNLLPQSDREILARLGLFAGTFTARDAAYVCGISYPSLIDRLSELRDNSLVQLLLSPGGSRYKLLDTVRDYLAGLNFSEEFASEREACRIRHAEHYAKVASEVGTLMAGGRWSDGSSLLMREIGNLRSAILTAIQFQRDDLLILFADQLARRLFESGFLADFRKLADAAYESSTRLSLPAVRVRLLGLDGALASREGNEVLCEQLWLERMNLSLQNGDIEQWIDATIDLAWHAFENGDPQTSRCRLISALRSAKERNDLLTLATVRVVQARLALESSNTRLAMHRERQAVVLIPKIEHLDGILFLLQNLTIINREVGNYPRSVEFTLLVLKIAVERNQVIHIGWALLELAPLYEKTEQWEMAARSYLAAMKVHAEYSTRHRSKAATALRKFRANPLTTSIQDLMVRLRRKPWEEILQGLPI